MRTGACNRPVRNWWMVCEEMLEISVFTIDLSHNKLVACVLIGRTDIHFKDVMQLLPPMANKATRLACRIATKPVNIQ